MRILLASSEVHPYSKTGGLADMVGALGRALAHAGHQVSVVSPLYRGIHGQWPDLRRVDWEFDLPLAHWRTRGSLWELQPEANLRILFVDQPGYFDRASLYQENGSSYADNGERFIFFSKCVAHLARYLPAQPDVVHVNDWQCALVPALLSHHVRAEGQGRVLPTCMTIHNLAYQGLFPHSAFHMTNLPPGYFSMEIAEFHGRLNCLKAGIALAHVVTTVSPRYAREITTEEFGCGLDGLVRKRRNSVFGILNGVDYDEWKTVGNPHLRHEYSIGSLAGKTANKLELQREMNLDARERVPLFGAISRLADQKGMDLLLGALEEMLHADIQFVLLGSGARNLETAFERVAKRFPGKAAVRLGYDQGLSHRIEAGCDFFVMPSRFEPCGLNQMYSLRYGTVPIVRSTGGLDDTVVDAAEDLSRVSGIKFTEPTAAALARAMRKALVIYEHTPLLQIYRLNGMSADYSWDVTVKQYQSAYEQAIAAARKLPER